MSTAKTSWQTNNQHYGSHYRQPQSLKKPKIGPSTLEFLKSTDYKNFIHEQENIAQKQRVGLFSQPMGLGPGDHYYDAIPEKPAKNVMTNQRMQQKIGPELFSKMSSNNIGDMYKDKFRENQLYNKEKTDMSIHPHAFLAGGKQKLVKNSEFEHCKDYNDKQYDTRDENGKVKTGIKNFLNNNMKSGRGNTTVGHLFSAYGYQHDPYDNARDKDRNDRLMHKAKIMAPFAAGSKPSETFTPQHELYDKNGEPYKPADQYDNCRSKSSGNWKYNNPNKKGFYGTFTKFPHYIQQGQQAKPRPQQEKIWKPNFNGTSKGLNETLNKPSMPPSQMVLNEIRRTKV